MVSILNIDNCEKCKHHIGEMRKVPVKAFDTAFIIDQIDVEKAIQKQYELFANYLSLFHLTFD